MIDIMLLYPSILAILYPSILAILLHEHNFNRMQMCLSYLTFIHKISYMLVIYHTG